MPRPENADAPLREQRGAEDNDAGMGKPQANHNSLLRRWQLLGAACCDHRLSRGDTAVLWSILDRIGPDGSAWPGYGRLAKDTGLHRATVARSVTRLVETDHLLRESGGLGKSNRYRPSSRVDATSRSDATSRMDATGLVAPARLPVVASTRPEPASLNPLKEPTQEKKRKKRASVSLPDWIPAESWQAWKRHRGRKLTDEAARRGIAKLDALRLQGHEPKELIERAIESGWASFYPASNQTRPTPAGHIRRDDRSEDELAAANEAELRRFGMIPEVQA